jgi:hypothetical protein
VKLSDAELALARQGRASDPRAAAALRFAARIIERRQLSPRFAPARRRTGRRIANAVLNVFTNYLNQVAETDIDFPIVRAGAPKAA